MQSEPLRKPYPGDKADFQKPEVSKKKRFKTGTPQKRTSK